MAYSKIEKAVLELAEPIAEENGCFIYDIEYVKEGSSRYLRLFIDREEGISLDECETVSRSMSGKLDSADPIKENYILEVSSPGVERRLRRAEHFERYSGSVIDIGLFKPVDGSKTLSGVLCGFDGKVITVETDGGDREIPLADTTYVRLHFDF